jgi:hypothetical protein
MMDVADPIERRITEVDVGVGHIDLCSQDERPVGKLPGPHPPEEVKALTDRPVPPGTVSPRFRRRSAVGTDLFSGELINVGESVFDQVHRPFVELFEVVRGVEAAFTPVKAEPPDIFLNGVDVFDILFGGIGIVEPQIAEATKLRSDAEVEDDRLGVADVKIAVRFRGNLVCTLPSFLPADLSSATMVRTKSRPVPSVSSGCSAGRSSDMSVYSCESGADRGDLGRGMDSAEGTAVVAPHVSRRRGKLDVDTPRGNPEMRRDQVGEYSGKLSGLIFLKTEASEGHQTEGLVAPSKGHRLRDGEVNHDVFLRLPDHLGYRTGGLATSSRRSGISGSALVRI